MTEDTNEILPPRSNVRGLTSNTTSMDESPFGTSEISHEVTIPSDVEEDTFLNAIADERKDQQRIRVDLEDLCPEEIKFGDVMQVGESVEEFTKKKLTEFNSMDDDGIEGDETYALKADFPTDLLADIERGRAEMAKGGANVKRTLVKVSTDGNGKAVAEIVKDNFKYTKFPGTMQDILDGELTIVIQSGDNVTFENNEQLNAFIAENPKKVFFCDNGILLGTGPGHWLQINSNEVNAKMETINMNQEFSLPELTTAVAVDIPGVEQAALAGVEDLTPVQNEDENSAVATVQPTKVGVIGVPGAVGSVAALIDAGVSASQETRQEDKIKSAISKPRDETKSQRKRRLAEEHNARINPNKLSVVKMRIDGLKVRLQVLAMSPREINGSRDRGDFIYYTINSATSANALNRLPIMVANKRSTINPATLDWLLDQVGETAAYEIRSGRMRASTATSFIVEKTEAEWIAKGFYVANGKVLIDSHELTM